jgi:hypothetical protein
MDGARVTECTRDVERLAAEALDAGRREEGTFVALTSAVERRIGSALARGEERVVATPACRPGCAACCTVNVATLAVEGIAIAAFLRARLAPADVAARAASLLAFHDRVRWCEDSERIRLRLACPFLDARGACAVHPVRPLACRGISSLDAGECRRALDERASGEGEGAVRMNLLQKALYDEALVAVAGALAARGLDARTRDVSGMAGAFLADAARLDAWAAGGRVPLE